MSRIHHVAPALLLVVFTTPLARAADPPAVGALKKQGLTRSGRYFVIEAEESVVEQWKRARPVLAEYAAAASRREEAVQAGKDLAQLEERRGELQQALDDMNQRISMQPPQPMGNRAGGFGSNPYVGQMMAQRNMIQMNLSQVASAQKALKGEAGPDKKVLEEERQKKLEAAKAALAELRSSVDAVTKRYEELGADTSVKAAFRALEEAKMGTFKLGPTPAFKATVKALENAERTVLAKKTATVSRKKGRSRR